MKLKNKTTKIVGIFFILICCFLFISGCDGNGQTPVEPDVPPVIEEPDTRVTLYFEPYGGEKVEPIKVEPGTTVTLPIPVRAGYIFNYWYTTEDLEFNTNVKKTVVVNETMTLYAGWLATDFNIDFITNCGIIVESINAYTDEQINLPIPNRPNYIFDGWYDEEGNIYTKTTMEPRNVVLTAKWTKAKETITLDANGGTLDSKYQKQALNDAGTVLLPTPERAGYTFIGWYNNDVLVTEDTVFTTSTILTAKYESTTKFTDTYKIEYNLDGGTLVTKDNTYKAGCEIVLGIPKRKGYMFLGWYKNPEFSGISIDKISVSDYGDKKLYAKWVEEDKEYDVAFIDHKGDIIETQKVKYGEFAEKIEYDGESYIEYLWFENDRVFDFSTPITTDIILTAKWRVLENILEDLVPNRTKDNIDLPTEMKTSLGNLELSWETSDKNTINLDGTVNPMRKDTVVTLTVTITYQEQSYEHSFDIIVEAVKLRDLSKTTPVFGYFLSNMGSYKGLDGVPKETIDVINHCFARVTSSGTVSLGELMNIQTVIEARKQGIRVLFSIGAYGTDQTTGCYNFSIAASTSEGRKKLVSSIIDVINRYHLDGIDIDWEYPGSFPAPGISSVEDRANYMLFMRELRMALDNLGEGYLLTAAVPGGAWAVNSYDVKGLAEIMDYLHLMTYDLHSRGTTSHHTALYTSKYAPNGSADSAVRNFINAGFPKEKLVVGAAFYGRIWTLSNSSTNVMGEWNIVYSEKDHVTYTDIKNDYLNRSTVRTYWDKDACAPYLYDTATKTVISYDNPLSIKYKCEYVKENGLGGLMFWDYGEDLTGTLINTIYQQFKAPLE